MDNIPDLRPLKISYFHLSSWKHLKGLHFPRMTDSRISLLIGANIPKAHWVLDQRRAIRNKGSTALGDSWTNEFDNEDD